MTDFSELPRETVFTDLVQLLIAAGVPPTLRMHFVPTSNESCKKWEINPTDITVAHKVVGTADYSSRLVMAELHDGEWAIVLHQRVGLPTRADREPPAKVDHAMPDRLAPAPVAPAPVVAPAHICPTCHQHVPSTLRTSAV